MIGSELGPYRIVEAIGAGGMGVVYRAHDTRLSRDVALKVLPQGALADESARKRFRNEAHALSRLSHPHIASLFDFDTTEDGTDFLVMELVSGPSLDATLRLGPLPEKEVVRLGAQIARALVAAHEQGIVHRDLKPQNVRLTADGLVKVLDFGLARIAPVLGALETEVTASGSIAGTPPYMSPEQLLGREVDARTDVYAAGVLFYEMATGRRPYGETSGPQLVAKILTEPMPMPREANAAISPLLEQVILKAADKDKELRHQTAKELLVDLERLAAGPGGPARSPGEGRTVWRRPAGWLAAAVALAALVAWAGQALRPLTPRIASFRTIAPRAHEFRGLATDGTNAWFVEKRFPTDAVFVVPLAGGEAREIPIPWDGRLDIYLFDVLDRSRALLVGKSTSLHEGFELWRLPLVGGAPTRIGELPNAVSARASRSGDRVAFVPAPGSPHAGAVVVAAASGGRPKVVVPARADVQREVLGWTVGDRAVRYSSSDESAQLLDASVDGNAAPRRTDIPGGAPGGFAEWSADGRFFVWGGEKGFFAFAERRAFGRAPAAPLPLSAPTHVVNLRFTPDGRRIVAEVDRPGSEVVLLGRDATDLLPFLGGARAGVAEFSPDGEWVAWVSNDGQPARVWRSRPDGSAAVALTDPDRLGVGPRSPLRWSPDGRRLAFSASVKGGGPRRIHLADVEHATVEPLSAGDAAVTHIDPCWAADGRSVVYSTFFPPFAPADETYLRRVDLESGRLERVAGSEGLWGPKCSRDGRILAYDSIAQARREEHGRTAFRLRDPRTGQWAALSVPLATVDYPTWSRDGRFVYASASTGDAPGLTIVRIEVATRQVATVARIEGLRSDGWMDLTPSGGFMVHRDASQREIVVMDWEAR